MLFIKIYNALSVLCCLLPVKCNAAFCLHAMGMIFASTRSVVHILMIFKFIYWLASYMYNNLTAPCLMGIPCTHVQVHHMTPTSIRSSILPNSLPHGAILRNESVQSNQYGIRVVSFLEYRKKFIQYIAIVCISHLPGCSGYRERSGVSEWLDCLDGSLACSAGWA